MKSFAIVFLLSIFMSFSYADSYKCDKEKKYISIVEAVSGVTREDWLKNNKDINKNYNLKSITSIRDDSVYFVVVNKIPLAVRDLKNSEVISLDIDKAKYFAGAHYHAEKDKKPYLIRAMFENLTGNNFTVKWDNQTKYLHVKYSSLGHSGGKFFSPLVVNLKEKPNKVILSFGGAI